MSNPLAADLFNKEFQFEGEDRVDNDPTVQFDQNGVDHLRNIVKDAQGNPLPITPEKPTPGAEADAAVPEYLKDYEEAMQKTLLTPDTKDYSAEAVSKFGPSFAHLQTRDAIYEQSIFNKTFNDEIRKDPNYLEYQNIVSDKADMGSLLKQLISDRLHETFNYTIDNYNTQLSNYFEDADKNVLNQKGKEYAEKLKRNTQGVLQNMEAEARAKASTVVANFKEYNSALETELKNFKPFGLDLPEDLRSHVQELIKSGKAKQAPQTPVERAQREILEALITDPAAAARFIAELDKRGFTHGRNTAAKLGLRNN